MTMYPLLIFLIWWLGFALGLLLGGLVGWGIACRWATKQINRMKPDKLIFK